MLAVALGPLPVIGQTRKRYGRWKFLGDATCVLTLLALDLTIPSSCTTYANLLSSFGSTYSILVGFFPSPSAPATRLTAYLASIENVKAFAGNTLVDGPEKIESSKETGEAVRDGPADVGEMMVD